MSENSDSSKFQASKFEGVKIQGIKIWRHQNLRHDINLEEEKGKLRCCFCRNSLANQEAIMKDYEGDFVAIYCKPCSQLGKQWGPKFVVCLCTPGKPKELDVEMAKSEIIAGNDKRILKSLGLSNEQVKTIVVGDNPGDRETVAFNPHGKNMWNYLPNMKINSQEHKLTTSEQGEKTVYKKVDDNNNETSNTNTKTTRKKKLSNL